MRSSDDAPNISFWILGFTWVLQFVFTFLATLLRSSEDITKFQGSEIFTGIAHAVVLLFAAYEDLRYGTSHVKWVVILAILMNFVMGWLAVFGIFALIAGVAAVVVGWYLIAGTGGLAVSFLAGFFAAGGSIGTVILVLLSIGAIISGMVTMSTAW